MKLKNRFLPVLICMFLCGCGLVREAGQNTGPTLPTGAVEVGTSSYTCITGESEQAQQLSGQETAKVKAFAHKIYNPNAKYVITLTTTVTGKYTSADAPAEILDITTSLSDVQMDGFTVSEHIAGDTATVVLYLNQMSICHFQYRIHPDGMVEFL